VDAASLEVFKAPILVGWGFEKHGLMEGVSAHGGQGGPVRSLPPQTILQFYEILPKNTKVEKNTK